MGVEYQPTTVSIGKAEKPGEWLEYSPLLTIFLGGCGIAYLAREVADKGRPSSSTSTISSSHS